MAYNDSPYNTEAVQASQWSARDEEREPRRPVRRRSSELRNERVRMVMGWAFVRNYNETPEPTEDDPANTNTAEMAEGVAS